MKKPIALCIAAAALVAAYGCSDRYVLQDKDDNFMGPAETRYKVLSFFFDGVPPPGAAKDAENNKPGKGQKSDVVSSFKPHGPYAAKLCNACHESGSNKLIQPIEELCLYCHSQVLSQAKKRLHGPLATGGCTICHSAHGSQYPYFLLDESKKFCYHCHNEKDVLRREVHNKTGEQCTSCHSAHSSNKEFLLKD
jgi:predicted CXXCH cytochrome family protein